MPDPVVVLAALATVAAVLIALPPVTRHSAAGRWRTRFGLRARRRAEPVQTAECDLLLDLTAGLLSAGVGIEAALDRLAAVVPDAQPLAGVHRRLIAGAPWAQAAEAVDEHPQLHTYCEHLSFAYATGAPSARMLQAAAGQVRSQARNAAATEAEKLSVKMLLPLAVCFLPAFVLLGVVPVVASMLPEALGI
ncbi:type II secretion system F family protein [Nesterenkonia sphaerica]|uniref:Type II secretion system F family protein n=1 Tax=Nesterenkonia sphaerica TaxID=1804988 RepID=A0A5R9A3B2_9MICC|nr:type II secretion system F family protein [Nesterenkonia sphaerica]TLP73112.1 type II secretion system F family protein [Nesterenkonia sphaerica]